MFVLRFSITRKQLKYLSFSKSSRNDLNLLIYVVLIQISKNAIRYYRKPQKTNLGANPQVFRFRRLAQMVSSFVILKAE